MKPADAVQIKFVQVEVTSSFEDGFRRFKSLVQKERIMAQVKDREHYVKPSDSKRKKRREAQERDYIQKLHATLLKSGELDKRKKRKEKRKNEKMQAKIKAQEDLV